MTSPVRGADLRQASLDQARLNNFPLQSRFFPGCKVQPGGTFFIASARVPVRSRGCCMQLPKLPLSTSGINCCDRRTSILTCNLNTSFNSRGALFQLWQPYNRSGFAKFVARRPNAKESTYNRKVAWRLLTLGPLAADL